MKKLLSGMGNTALTQIIMRTVQLVVNALLARLLTPADYGIVFFANALVELLYHMNALGLPTALIQIEPLRQETKNTSMTLAILLGIAAFLLAQLAAPLAGILLNSPDSVAVVRVLAFAFLVTPFGLLQLGLLTRDMKFGSLRNAQVCGTLVRAVVSVGMALSGWKYWSLAIGHLVGTVSTSLMLVLLHPMRWSLQLDRTEMRRLLAIGVPLTLATLITFGLTKADAVLIGSMSNDETLGYYAIAFQWSTVSCLLIAEIVHLVLLPYFARMQSNPTGLRAGLVRVLVPIAVLSSLAAMCLFAVTDWFLFDILGKGTDRWLPAGDVMRVLCVYSMLRALTETLDSPILAMGDTKVLLKSNLVAAVIEIAVLPLAILWGGVTWAAIVVTGAYATQWLIFLPYLHRRLGLSLGDLARTLVPVGIACVAAVFAAAFVPTDGLGPRVEAAVRVVVVCVSLIAVHELLTRGKLLAETRAVVRALRSPS